MFKDFLTSVLSRGLTLENKKCKINQALEQASAFVLEQASMTMWEIPKEVLLPPKIKVILLLFLMTSPFSEKKTVSVGANGPWRFCLCAVLWSHESTDLCCYSQLSPDFPHCRTLLIILNLWLPCDRSCHRDGFHDAVTCQMHQWW